MPIAVAMTAAIVVSCQKEIESEVPGEEQIIEEEAINSLTFSITDNEATKTIIAENDGKKYSNWETGDKIGYVTSRNDKGSATVTLGSPATFTIDAANGLAVDDEVEVWYPYRKAEADKSTVQMIIPVYQIQAGDSFDFDAMPMVAEPITITSDMLSGDDYVGTINFANLASLIEFKVFSSVGTYESEKVAAITFDAGSSNIAGHFNMNVGAVDFDTPATLAFSGYTGKSVTTSLASPVSIGTDKASARNVYMVVAPGTYTGNIIVTTDAAFYTIPISGKEFERSGFKSFGIDLAKNVATRRSLKGNTAIELNQISYASADENDVIWEDGLSMIDVTKGTSNANSYLPPERTSTRFYNTGTLSFTTGSKQVEKVVFTATTESFASALAGSTWTNATASASGSTVTVLPIDGSTDFSADITANNGHTKIQIYYDDNTYTISSASNPVAGGSFTIKKGASDVTEAKVNTTITLAADANSGYSFASWTVKDAENNDIPVVSNEFQMPASNVTVTANFAEAAAAKTISITTPSNGTVSTDPVGSASPGSTVTITATPDSGYGVNTITVVDEDSTPVSVTDNQFTMPSKNVTVTVTFTPVYNLTCSKNDSNNGYATYYDITQNSISWKAPGNQSLGAYWQIGGLKKSNKSDPANTDTRYICMQGANKLSFDVSTITIYTNGLNNTNLVINSITVTAHDNAADALSGDNAVASFTTSSTLTFAANTDKDLVYTKTGTTDCTGKDFRIAINATNNYTTNYGLKIKSIKLQ